MKRTQISTNVSQETRNQADELITKCGYSLRDVVTLGIEKLYTEKIKEVKMHTVISKSGWQGDFWRIRQTFDSRSQAEEYAASIKTSDPKENGYNVQIKSHRKSLAKLMTRNEDIRFADGTCAVWDV